MIQSLQNPFRDWNRAKAVEVASDVQIQSLQNPFRDWNKIDSYSDRQVADRDSKPPKPF